MANSRLDEWLSNWPIGFQKAQELSEAWERQQRESALSTVPSQAMRNYLQWRGEFEAEQADQMTSLNSETQFQAEKRNATDDSVQDNSASGDGDSDSGSAGDIDCDSGDNDSDGHEEMGGIELPTAGEMMQVRRYDSQSELDEHAECSPAEVEDAKLETEQRLAQEAPGACDIDTDDDSEEYDEGPDMDMASLPQQISAEECARGELQRAFEQEKVKAWEEQRRRQTAPARARAILRVAAIAARSISSMQQNIKRKQAEIRKLKDQMAAARRDSDDSTIMATHKELQEQISELLVMKVEERRKAQALSVESTCPSRNSTAVVVSTRAQASSTL